MKKNKHPLYTTNNQRGVELRVVVPSKLNQKT